MKKGVLYGIAVLLPLVPLTAWIVGSWQQFTEPLGAAFFGLYVPARAFGLLGFVLMFYQFLLASRIPFLETVLPRAQQLKTHRTLGKVGGIMIVLHGTCMLLFDMITLGSIAFTLGKLIGIIALFLLINAVVAAWFLKALKFKLQTWRRIHYAAYVVFPLVFVHAILIGSAVRGYLAVRLLFIVLLAVYAVLLVRRLVGGQPGTKTKSPKAPKVSAPASTPEGTAGAEAPTA